MRTIKYLAVILYFIMTIMHTWHICDEMMSSFTKSSLNLKKILGGVASFIKLVFICDFTGDDKP